MSKHEKQSQPSTRFIYDPRTRQKFPCTEEQFKAFYDEAGRIRKREQYHKRCMCPKSKIWTCDGDCVGCEFHAAGDTLSLDAANTEDGENLYDTELTEQVSMEDVIATRMLLEQLFDRLRELDPEADTIIEMWMNDDKVSDRAIAERLGRPQRTFADQMKRYRTELRKIRGF